MNYFKLILFFLPLLGYTQENLILNGNFEEYWECPEALTEIEKCKYVYNPCDNSNELFFSSTSDYFNTCSDEPNSSVPNNTFGYQEAKSGNGYVGLVNCILNSQYKEYIQLKFSKELISYNVYELSFYLALSDVSGDVSKSLGVCFVNNELNIQNYLSSELVPDTTLNLEQYQDTSIWYQLTFQFVANGNENYVVIGNFNNDSSSDCIHVFEGSNPLLNGSGAYYFFDDFELMLIKEAEPIKIPNVFTPNNDGINDTFDLISGYVLFDEIIIRNRWGNIVHQSKQNAQWDGNNQNGNPLYEGVYFVQVISKREDKKGKKKQYSGMVHLIR